MRRWHEERQLMLRRWRIEIAEHEDAWPRMGTPPLPPLASERTCHCNRGAGYFRKRHPYDCGNARCGLCSYDKLFPGIRRQREKRAWQATEAVAY